MKKTIAIAGVVFLLTICAAFASQKPAPYSLMVKLATEKQVYVWPWVKAPGAYTFEKNKTIGDLIKSAGGFIKDERLKKIPSLYVYPDRVCVYRPTKKDPDPTKPFFVFKLDWSKPDGGIADCKFALQEKDLVAVSMK